MKVSKKPTPADLQQLRSAYPKGAVLFREQDERDCAYIIEKGEVEISVTKEGKNIPLIRLGEGEVFGETALLGPGPRSAMAVVTQDCEVFRISPDAVRDRIMSLDPIVGLLMSLLVNRYRQWRHVPPETAAAALNTPVHVGGSLKEVDGADDFLRTLHAQKEVALKELRMAQEITQAIEKDQFGPYLQPIVSLPDQKLLGFEALLRWHHPEKGMIPPLEFIPVAERTNVVWHLDMLVLRRACSIIQELQKAAGNDRKLYISVNLSGVHFDSEELPRRIGEIVKESGADPSQIVLEITESALMGDPMVAEKVLKDLRQQGLHIALDDFGTGYSSLSYLHRFSIDMLKIDRSFVQDIHNNVKSLDVVRAIVSLAKTFNLKIVAEGIESKNEIYSLAGLGCDCGQGYFFSKPLPVEKAIEFVKNQLNQ